MIHLLDQHLKFTRAKHPREGAYILRTNSFFKELKTGGGERAMSR